MSQLLLQTVQILDPGGPCHEQTADVLLDDSGIVAIHPEAEALPKDAERVSAAGTFLSPGWVDVGTTLHDPGAEWKETQQALAKAARMGGFTTLVPYPSTSPLPDQAEIIRALNQRFASQPVHIRPMGKVSIHSEGKNLAELYDMHLAGAAAFADGPLALEQEGLLLRALRYLSSFSGKLLLGGITPFWATHGHMHEGPVSVSMGVPGIPDMVEVNAVQRDLEVLRYVGAGSIHFQPLSSPKAVGLVASARAEGLAVSCGVPTYLFAWTDADLQSFDENLKTVPPLRSRDLQAALIEALQQGKVDMLCTGHRAEGREEKLVEFALAEPGMINLPTAYSQVQENLIAPGHLTAARWVELISTQPRKLFGLPPAHLEPGATECTWFAPEVQWQLHSGDIPSRAKNSPHLGQTMQGKVQGTWAKGIASRY